MKNKTYNKKKMLVVFSIAVVLIVSLMARLFYLMVFDAEHYQKLAKDLHERERKIKAARGEILDRNGVVLAANKTVCTISVIHSQVTEPEKVARILAEELEMDESKIAEKIQKVTSMEKIRTNVEKETGDRIRDYDLDGVKVDEDFKRYYPYRDLASRVLGFTGGDNQGIIGLEVKYEEYLKGINGTILTVTDARGIELEGVAEDRIEPVAGGNLRISMDYNIQSFCQQAAEKVLEEKQADSVSVLLMNPQNGEILAMVNVPEFNLNTPYELNTEVAEEPLSDVELQERLNRMWRNECINDTYEPGSTFKIITLLEFMREYPEEYRNFHYDCNGVLEQGDYTIQCYHKTAHGSQNLEEAFANSCNGAFAAIGMMLDQKKLSGTTQELLYDQNLPVPLSYSKSVFTEAAQDDTWQILLTAIGQGKTQITPMHSAMITAAIANGGTLMKPYLMDHVVNAAGEMVKAFTPEAYGNLMTASEAEALGTMMRAVVTEGTGSKLKNDQYTVAGKTGSAEFETGKETHAWFTGYAPAENPQLAVSVIVEEGGSGGAAAAPIARAVFDNWFSRNK